VATAQRILLYVHGIIGDTRFMIASARTGWLMLPTTPPALAERYDLLLTFDYESVNTTIQENARKLKERLRAVGLGPNHGKTLHVVAHSMGGLVARWFLEREGGGAERMVQHLVMLGTPNAGSPWPTVQDWVTTGVGIALNLLSVVALPVKVFGGLVSAIETIDVALDQMKPGDELLQMLATSPDPHVPYTIIAGNTSVIRTALEPEPGQTKGRFARLWDKIKPKQWWYATLDLAFFHQPNDIAVSVESIQSVSSNRTPAPEKVPPVACDHVAYFNTEEGLHALAAALEQAPTSYG
jgi:pimeloyl-ACP methyl ester carboxylesterase